MRSHPHSTTVFLFFLFLLFASLFTGCQLVAAPLEEPTLPAAATALPTAATAELKILLAEDGAETQALCEESGNIQTLSLDSDLLNDVLTFNVYFPPCYDPDSADSYPVIYLLHGQRQAAALWQTLDIQTAADDLILNQCRQPFLIVMPTEEYYFRSVKNNRYPDALIAELLPWVETNLAACTQKRMPCHRRYLARGSLGHAFGIRSLGYIRRAGCAQYAPCSMEISRPCPTGWMPSPLAARRASMRMRAAATRLSKMPMHLSRSSMRWAWRMNGI